MRRPQLDVGGRYRLTMRANGDGSTLTLERTDGGGSGPAQIGTHDFTRADDKGAADWEPFLFARTWSDELRIRKVGDP